MTAALWTQPRARRQTFVQRTRAKGRTVMSLPLLNALLATGDNILRNAQLVLLGLVPTVTVTQKITTTGQLMALPTGSMVRGITRHMVTRWTETLGVVLGGSYMIVRWPETVALPADLIWSPLVPS